MSNQDWRFSSRFSLVLAVSIITLAAAHHADAAVRISGDAGGRIGSYLDALATLRASGQTVIIDGPCLSACTMVLGMIPRDRICVTRRARLGFHAAWIPGRNGRPVLHKTATKLLMDTYPPNIRRWISKRGGLKRRMIYLRGSELLRMYRHCR